MSKIEVFIDANIFKFSALRRQRLAPRTVTLQFEKTTVTSTVYDFTIENTVLRANSNRQYRDLRHLPMIAFLGIKEIIRVNSSFETIWESMGLPKSNSLNGNFFNCPIKLADSPINHARVLGSANRNPRHATQSFLENLRHNRNFMEICRGLGGFQGSKKPLNTNQALDAFHYWCAEHAGCNYFLTMDYKLIKQIKNLNLSCACAAISPKEFFLESICSIPMPSRRGTMREALRFARDEFGRTLPA